MGKKEFTIEDKIQAVELHIREGMGYGKRKELERSNRNMPVAYCCHQFKNWWVP